MTYGITLHVPCAVHRGQLYLGNHRVDFDEIWCERIHLWAEKFTKGPKVFIKHFYVNIIEFGEKKTDWHRLI